MDIQKYAEELEDANLKAQALLERVSALTSEYENKVADLRVAVTRLNNENERNKQIVADLQAERAPAEGAGTTVAGEVIE